MEHKNIPDSQLHETKGASTAVARQALIATGSGTATFRALEQADLPASNTFILNGYSTASTQNPSAVDTPLQVEFGATQTTADATLSNTGTLTFNTAGKYNITLFLRFGRTTGAGTAILLNRVLLNDVQALRTNAISLVDLAGTIPFSATLPVNVTAGTTFKVQIARDSGGVNNGGLVQTTPTTLGWFASPSASIIVTKVA